MFMTKFFRNDDQYKLECDVNYFIRGKKIISVSYSTEKLGYSVHHFCCVLYEK